jgi:hypothetical protein
MLLKKVSTFSAPPHPKDTSGGCQKGDVPHFCWGEGLKGAVVPLIAKKNLDLLEAKNEPKSIIREYVTNAEKPLTLSQSLEKFQHFEINFDGKNRGKIVIFVNFALVAMVTGNLRLSMSLQRQWPNQHLSQV